MFFVVPDIGFQANMTAWPSLQSLQFPRHCIFLALELIIKTQRPRSCRTWPATQWEEVRHPMDRKYLGVDPGTRTILSGCPGWTTLHFFEISIGQQLDAPRISVLQAPARDAGGEATRSLLRRFGGFVASPAVSCGTVGGGWGWRKTIR